MHARSESRDYKVKQTKTKKKEGKQKEHVRTSITFPSFSQFTGFPGYRSPLRQSQKPSGG